MERRRDSRLVQGRGEGAFEPVKIGEGNADIGGSCVTDQLDNELNFLGGGLGLPQRGGGTIGRDRLLEFLNLG